MASNGLRRQNFTLQMSGGVDTKSDPYQISPFKMSRMENAVFTKLKQVRKRNGYGALPKTIAKPSGSSSLLAASALTSFKEELVCVSTTSTSPSKPELFSYSDGSDSWVSKGVYTPCSVASDPVAKGTIGKKSSSSVVTNEGIEISLWEQSSNVMYSAFDYSTKQMIVPPTLLASSSSKPIIIQSGSSTVAYYFNNLTSSLYAVVFSLFPTVTAGSPVAMTSGVPGSINTINLTSAKSNFDVKSIDYGLGEYIFLAFSNDAGGVTVRTFSPSFPTTLLNQKLIATLSPDCICVSNYDILNSIAVTFAIGPLLYNSVIDGQMNGSFTSPVLISTSGHGNYKFVTSDSVENDVYSDFFRIFATSLSVSNTYRTDIFKTNGVSVSSSTFALNTCLVTSAAKYNDRCFVGLAGLSNTTGFSFPLQNQLAVVSDETDFVETVARAYYGSHSGVPTTGGPGNPVLAPINNPLPNVIRFSVVESNTISTDNGNIRASNGVSSCEINFASAPVSDNRSEIGGSLILGGAILNSYDGGQVTELGFNYWPDSVSVSLGAGGGLSAGSYSWVACYEWVDQNGYIHRSAPSLPISQTATAGQSATVTVSNLHLTRKQTAAGRENCQIVLYRTLSNGVVYYRVSSISSATFNDPYSFTTNISDTLSDAQIASNPFLYTTGGVVENIVYAPMRSLATHRARLFGVDTTEPNKLWYSRQTSPNAPVEFSEVFSLMIDNRGGEVTALASLDDKLIVFKKNVVMMISGQGPDNLGGQSDFSDSMLITSDCGCIDSKSIVQMPLGLMFQGEKGIYLLTRSLELKYIGAEVEAYNQYEVVSSQLMADTNQVRFLLSNGVAAVYDYFVEQWAIFTNHAAVDSVVWKDRFCYIRSDGTVMVEDSSRTDDDGSFVKMLVSTSWVQFSTDAGEYIAATETRMPMTVQGFQRAYKVLVLGQYIGPHKLNVEICHEYNDSPTQTSIVQAPQLQPPEYYGEDNYGDSSPYGSTWVPYQWRIDLSRQKCQTVKVTISDMQQGTSLAESVRISAIAFELGLKPGLNRIPMSNVLG